MWQPIDSAHRPSVFQVVFGGGILGVSIAGLTAYGMGWDYPEWAQIVASIMGAAVAGWASWRKPPQESGE